MTLASLFTPGRALQLLVVPIDDEPYRLPKRGDGWTLRLGGVMPSRYDTIEAPVERVEPLDITVEVRLVEATFGASEMCYVEGFIRRPAPAGVTAFVRVDDVDSPGGMLNLLAQDGTAERVQAAFPAAAPVGFVRLTIS